MYICIYICRYYSSLSKSDSDIEESICKIEIFASLVRKNSIISLLGV